MRSTALFSGCLLVLLSFYRLVSIFISRFFFVSISVYLLLHLTARINMHVASFRHCEAQTHYSNLNTLNRPGILYQVCLMPGVANISVLASRYSGATVPLVLSNGISCLGDGIWDSRYMPSGKARTIVCSVWRCFWCQEQSSLFQEINTYNNLLVKHAGSGTFVQAMMNLARSRCSLVYSSRNHNDGFAWNIMQFGQIVSLFRHWSWYLFPVTPTREGS